MVTYEQLKRGYVLQKGDKLVLHGLNYEVKNSGGSYLSNLEGTNSRVFDILGMGAEERKNFVKKFNPVNYGEAQGAFPEFSDLRTLTDLVIALYEVPEYKIGDWVTVLPRASDSYEPIVYADEMVGYAGNTYQVKSYNSRNETPTCNGADSGDPYSYNLDGVGFYWTSQMIRKATEEEIRKAKRGIKDFPTPSEMMTPGRIGTLSEEAAKKLNAEIEEMLKSISPIPREPIWGFNPPVYSPWWKDTPSDTEVRLPNNEEETPHIKL